MTGRRNLTSTLSVEHLQTKGVQNSFDNMAFLHESSDDSLDRKNTNKLIQIQKTKPRRVEYVESTQSLKTNTSTTK
tara:strand:- start:36 stop:263 length:228 start_codon:yes stop_codon:yes gene_type:complete